jgi:carbon storage regulator
MLVLGRKIGQRIRLGDKTVVSVLGIKGGQVRLGVEAPEHVIVLRDEVCSQWREPERLLKSHAKTRRARRAIH